MLCMHLSLLDLIAAPPHMNQFLGHLLISVCVEVMHVCAIICLRRPGDNLWKLVLSSHHGKPGDGAQMVRPERCVALPMQPSCWIIFTFPIITLDFPLYSQQDRKLPDGPITCHFILCSHNINVPREIHAK